MFNELLRIPCTIIIKKIVNGNSNECIHLAYSHLQTLDILKIIVHHKDKRKFTSLIFEELKFYSPYTLPPQPDETQNNYHHLNGDRW